MDLPALESRVAPGADHEWILKQLRRLDANRRLKLALLPYISKITRRVKDEFSFILRHGSGRCACTLVEGSICTEYESFAALADEGFADEIRGLTLWGARINHSPLADMFRDHPEELPKYLGLDPQLDDLIAARLKTA